MNQPGPARPSSYLAASFSNRSEDAYLKFLQYGAGFKLVRSIFDHKSLNDFELMAFVAKTIFLYFFVHFHLFFLNPIIYHGGRSQELSESI